MSVIQELKRKLRSDMKMLLKAMRESERLSFSLSVVENLKPLLRSELSVLGVYSPLPGEVDWKGIEVNIKTAFPRATAESFGMEFRLSLLSELVEEVSFGRKFLVPSSRAILVTPDALLVPGLAFDEEGYRLGRGKGYYDRYLANFSGPKIGLGLERQMVKKVPREVHDYPLDYIVTEEKIRTFVK